MSAADLTLIASLLCSGLGRIHTERAKYETPWNRWHTLRTVASVTSLGLTSLACMLPDGE